MLHKLLFSWIDGFIEVGREGEELAFINWKDTDPLSIKYFSFGTWPGIEAKWYYDCPCLENITANSKVIKNSICIFHFITELLNHVTYCSFLH